MFKWSRHAAAVTAVLALAACAGLDPAAPDERNAGVGTASALRTDSSSYVLQPAGVGLTTVIGISFTNRSRRTMYIINCQGGLATTLEKRVSDQWVPYWSPVLLMCLSAPITIQPGATYTRSVPVWGAPPGLPVAPAWASADVAGTYRMVLGSVVWNYTTQGQRFGDPVPLEMRTSNEFSLQR
jgi:hypothetical protein